MYRLFSAAGAVLLFGFYPRSYAAQAFGLRVGAAVGWTMVTLTVLGLLFTWWARVYLGRLWSSAVTRKVDHRIVDTGPYALVRHPIYAGILLATLATAVIRGTLPAFLGATSIIFALYFKARVEERFLREQLGRENYDSYARRVPMLVPLMPAFLRFGASA